MNSIQQISLKIRLGLDPAEDIPEEKLRTLISAAIPQGHRDFADELLDAHGVPRLNNDGKVKDRLTMTEATSAPLVDIALQHDNVKLIANALGTPPPEIIKQIQDTIYGNRDFEIKDLDGYIICFGHELQNL